MVLASRSPQRRAILERLGVAFTVRPADVEELDRGDPGEVALENARRKARAARRLGTKLGVTAAVGAGERAEVLLGCDTLVACSGTIYGKPEDEHEARATLRALSGATHEVFSGLVLLFTGEERERTALVRTVVTFRTLDDELLEWSLASGEWRGRAGGYAIQGKGSALVAKVEGDYENVVGLPLAALLEIYPELPFACK